MALDLQWLERVVQGDGKLLRVLREPVAGPGGARRSRSLVWTFDVGGIALHVQRGSVVAEAMAPDADPSALLTADEDDPWWMLLGHPLTKASERADGALLVQFRADANSPKILVLAAHGDAIDVETVI